MLSNYSLIALLEASKAKNQDNQDDDLNFDDPTQDTDTDNAETNTNTKEDTTPEDNNNESDNKEDSENKENKDDQGDESNDDNKNDDNPDDDFNLDPDGSDDSEGEDSGENPDGLPDPDYDGSDDTDNIEQNVHTNILELSKLDRQMAKRKIFNDMRDLRSSVVAAKNMIDKNESVIDAAVRDYVMNKLDYLYSIITDYLTYKFSFTNYEENMQNHLIFAKELNDLLIFTKTNQNGFVNKSMDPKQPSKKSKHIKAEKIDVDKSIEAQEDEDEESENGDIDENLDTDES